MHDKNPEIDKQAATVGPSQSDNSQMLPSQGANVADSRGVNHALTATVSDGSSGRTINPKRSVSMTTEETPVQTANDLGWTAPLPDRKVYTTRNEAFYIDYIPEQIQELHEVPASTTGLKHQLVGLKVLLWSAFAVGLWLLVKA